MVNLGVGDKKLTNDEAQADVESGLEHTQEPKAHANHPMEVSA